jgi:hypothetical protein
MTFMITWFSCNSCLRPGDDQRIAKLHDILERAHSAAHITCFWRGDPGEAPPRIPDQFKSAIAPLAADMETDFAADRRWGPD